MSGDTLSVIIGIVAIAVIIASGIIVRKIRSNGRNSLIEIYGNAKMDQKEGDTDDK